MNYEDYLDKINILLNENNEDILKELENAPEKNNFNEMLIPKINELINKKFIKSVEKIMNNLEEIYTDQQYLDYYLTNFKNNIKFILRICHLKNLPEDLQAKKYQEIKNEVTKTYKIINDEAIKIDPIGYLSNIIKNNEIKWSDNNEL